MGGFQFDQQIISLINFDIMTTLQSKLITSINSLPDKAVREILDFAEFLRQKYSKTSEGVFQAESMSNQETNHLEEEFKDYRQNFPHE